MVNGVPGTGKSTLAARLSVDLDVPLLGKNMLKELMADAAPQPVDDETGKLLGKIATNMLYMYAEAFLANERTVVIESALWAEFARADIRKLLERTNATSLEIYCATTGDESRRRLSSELRMVAGMRCIQRAMVLFCRKKRLGRSTHPGDRENYYGRHNSFW